MDQLNQALGILVELIKSTKDFVGDQAPRVAQEIVTYHFYMSVMSACAFLLVGIFCIAWLPRTIRWAKKVGGESGSAVFFLGLAAVILIAAAIAESTEAVKAKVAPRLVVLDYLQANLKR